MNAANPLIEGETPTSMPQSSKIFYGVYKAGQAYGNAITQGQVDVGDIASSTFSSGSTRSRSSPTPSSTSSRPASPGCSSTSRSCANPSTGWRATPTPSRAWR
nr:hypothetical protein GCM10025732_25690 [Glycomyces mayteni]